CHPVVWQPRHASSPTSSKPPSREKVGEAPAKGKVKTSPLRANKRVATIARCRGICLALDLGSLVFRRSWHGRLARMSVERLARAGRPCHYPVAAAISFDSAPAGRVNG